MTNAKSKPNEIYLERIYDAPVKMVWEAMADPEQAKHWWGPRGFTITTHKKELKVGGCWEYIMHGPDGKDWPNTTQYLEVTPYSRMVYDHGGNKDQKPMFRVTMNLVELASNKTKMEMWMALPSEEAAKATKSYIKQASGDSCWDRLGEFLEEKQTKKDIFIINRTFDTPIEMMFKVWTEPGHLSIWNGPTGSKIDYLKIDIKAGGSSFYCMTTADNSKMYGKVKYHEVTKSNRLVYTQYFCDENQNTIRPAFAPTWPEAMRTTITFAAENEKQTRVTLNWEVEGDATAIERETFNKAKAGMTMGWTGSFDKLEDYLKL